MAKMDKTRPADSVNIDKSIIFTHIFHFLFSAAKACIFPFLTIYFRLLGLTATQAGLLIAAKVWMSVIIAPFWTKCAKACNKKKVVLMFSLIMMLVGNLSLTLIPPLNPSVPLRYCKGENMSAFLESLGPFNETKPFPVTSQFSTIAYTKAMSTEEMGNEQDITTNKIIENLETSTKATTTTAKQRNFETSTSGEEGMSSGNKEPFGGEDEVSTNGESEKEDILAALGEENIKLLESFGIDQQTLESMTTEQLTAVIAKLVAIQDGVASSGDSETGTASDSDYGYDYNYEDKDTAKHRRKRDIFQTAMGKIRDNLNSLKLRVDQLEYKTFTITLIVILLCELFAAPTEKLADDIWFNFLDGMDVLEKYGQHRNWATMGMIVLPPMVTAMIDHSSCFLSHGILSFHIHFFAFAGMLFLSFVVGFCYPVFSGKKIARKGSAVKGFKILCSDMHSLSYSITLLVVGVTHACTYNFMFWMIQDLGGPELVMGVAVTVAGLSELFISLVQRFLIKKITHPGAIILSLTFLSIRLVFYSFMWTPWLVVIGEALHGVSYTLMWATIQSYPDFRINPFTMDRSAKAVLEFLYKAIGFGGGSVLGGFLYDKIGLSTLLQGSCILVFSWAFVFAIIHKCVKRKQKVRYARLLQAEDDYSEGDDESDDLDMGDDWLEVAMKENTFTKKK